MTIAREIEKLIERLDGVAVCDACITDTPNLSVPAQANVVTRALAGQHGFATQEADTVLRGAARTELLRSPRYPGFDGAAAPRPSRSRSRSQRPPAPHAPA